MGYLTITDEVTPSTPAAARGSLFFDSADNGRLKAIRPDGQLYVMNMSGFDKNLLINGGFDFFQRQNPAAATNVGASATARAFGADRWGCTAEAVDLQSIRVDTNTAPEVGLTARYYGTFTKITNAGKACICQVLEGFPTMPLRGRKVRLQVKMRRTSGAAITMRLGLWQLTSAGTIDTMPGTVSTLTTADGTDITPGTNLAAITPDAGSSAGAGTIVGAGVDCVLTTAWQLFSAVFTVPSNCKNLLVMIFSNANLAVNDAVAISEAGLYDGPDVIDWVPIPYQLELDRARRFFEKSFGVDTLPATNVGVNTGEARGIAGKAGAVANSGFIPIEYKVTKRASPAVTVFNPAAANALARNITGAADMGATTITGGNVDDFYTNSTGVAATAVGDLIAIHYTANAEL